jgi:hypothetical protein
LGTNSEPSNTKPVEFCIKTSWLCTDPHGLVQSHGGLIQNPKGFAFSYETYKKVSY